MARLSFRDPTTDVLKAHGFMDVNDAGDLSQAEADDFALVPGTVQWNGTAWVAYTPTPDPAPATFLALMLAELGNEAANALLAAYPLAFQSIQIQPYNWPVFESEVIRAHDALDITDEVYEFIRTTAADTNFPITLPPLVP